MLLAGALSITPMFKLLSSIGGECVRNSKHLVQACLVALISTAHAARCAFGRCSSTVFAVINLPMAV